MLNDGISGNGEERTFSKGDIEKALSLLDNTSLRLGNKTVHTKWDTNTAILSGDA